MDLTASFLAHPTATQVQDLTASFLAHPTATQVQTRPAQILEKSERSDQSFSQKCTKKQQYPSNTEEDHDC
jgi:hypothetical protein